MAKKLESLVFSKNRPMQLELLLNSHQRFWGEDITVLYRATDIGYLLGYLNLENKYPKVKFLPETNFKQQVVEYVKRNKYVVFFCDDDVMIRPTRSAELTQPLKSNYIICSSLRLDPKYDFHFESGTKVPLPDELINNPWAWRKAKGDWNFPMSVLGHVFRSEDLLPLCETLIYNSPNQLESALAENPINKPYMVCFDEAKTINIPAILVQDIYPNRAGRVSVKGLNDKFLGGWRIDLADIIKQTKSARSCFVLVPFKFRRQDGR